MRQGDVLLIPVDANTELPAIARLAPREGGRVVLAHGEVTGHAHAIADREVELFTLAPAGTSVGDEVDRWLRVQRAEGATLVHDEHTALHVPAGDYLVRRQREYAPGPVPTRLVAD